MIPFWSRLTNSVILVAGEERYLSGLQLQFLPVVLHRTNGNTHSKHVHYFHRQIETAGGMMQTDTEISTACEEKNCLLRRWRSTSDLTAMDNRQLPTRGSRIPHAGIDLVHVPLVRRTGLSMDLYLDVWNKPFRLDIVVTHSRDSSSPVTMQTMAGRLFISNEPYPRTGSDRDAADCYVCTFQCVKQEGEIFVFAPARAAHENRRSIR